MRKTDIDLIYAFFIFVSEQTIFFFFTYFVFDLPLSILYHLFLFNTHTHFYTLVHLPLIKCTNIATEKVSALQYK